MVKYKRLLSAESRKKMSRLTLAERIVIECGIYQKLKLSEIAKKLTNLPKVFQGKSE